MEVHNKINIRSFSLSNGNLKNDENYDDVLQLLDNIEFKTILDAGCGNGVFLMKLLSKYKNIKAYGLDISEEILREAKYKLGRRAFLSVGDIKSTNYSDNMFDIILLNNTIEYTGSIYETFDEIYRILKPEGIIIISDYIIQNNKKNIFKFINKYSKCEVRNVYSKEEIMRHVSNSNFKKIKYKSVNDNKYILTAFKNN